MNENRFCVYGYYSNGVPFYIGEGVSKRPYQFAKSRSEILKERLSEGNFEVVIIADNLSKESAIKIEQETIRSLTESGVELINIQRNRKKHETLTYEFCKNLWYISEESKSGIKWLDFNPSSVKIVKDKDAGAFNERGYFSVRFNKTQYQVHRIVWVLYNMTNLSPDLVVNHIDSNPSNNSPDNLIAVTQSENSFLKDERIIEARNCTGLKGVFRLESDSGWYVRWREDGKEHVKRFYDKDYSNIESSLGAALNFREEKDLQKLRKKIEIINTVKQKESEARNAKLNQTDAR